jgi:ABC-type transport system substrate-binding protein
VNEHAPTPIRTMPLYALTTLALLGSCAFEPRVARHRAPRIALRAGPEAARELSSLSYRGGFEAKTLVYETLVRRDGEGRIVPGLASAWRFDADGKACTFELREGARFHDGTPVDAEAVRVHFQRWVGLPEHDWLPANRLITGVRAEGPRTLRVELARQHALLADLCAVNPCAIRAPGTLDAEGEFVRPIGSGPYAFVEAREGERVLLLQREPTGAEVQTVELVRYDKSTPGKPLDDLLAGRLDVLVDGWNERIPRQALLALQGDRRFRVVECMSSTVVYLSFRLEGGPCADEELRRSIQALVDRDAFVRVAERGFGAPCRTWAAPSVEIWPRSKLAAHAKPVMPPATAPLRLLVQRGGPLEVPSTELARQLRAHGIAIELVALEGEALAAATKAGEFDLRLERTWGVPYDPELSLAQRFGSDPLRPGAAQPVHHGRDAALRALVEAALAEWDEERRTARFALVQDEIDRRALVVPLYVPARMAVVRSGLAGLRIDHDLYRLDLDDLAWSAD